MKLKELLVERFTNPPISKEEKYLQKIADELKISFKDLVQAFNLGQLSNLSNIDWENMENTESWNITNLKKLKSSATESCKREWQLLLRAFKQNNNVEAPVVLFRKGKNPYLITGNARLVCMRIMKIQPKIFRINL